MSKIQEALAKRFDEHRLIFWYDPKEELTQQYNDLNLDAVEKIHVQGNEFEIKYTVLKEKPETKFLLYFTTEKPNAEDNWLLDLELAHHEFHTDKQAMYLQELGLDYHLKELVAEHLPFFEAKERRQKLKERITQGDNPAIIREKMLSILFNTEYCNLNTFVQIHTAACLKGSDLIDKALERYGLKTFYWENIATTFGYKNDTPSIYDLLLELFSNNWILNPNRIKQKESRLLLEQWKDTLQYREVFEHLSRRIEADTVTPSTIETAPLDSLIKDDLFRVVEQKIVHILAEAVLSKSMKHSELILYIKQRENKFWYNEFADFYGAIEQASKMMELVSVHGQTKYTSFTEGVDDYASNLYSIDMAYRKFIWALRKLNHNGVLENLATKVEKVYANEWLLPYNDKWQAVIDSLEDWPTWDLNSQLRFFEVHLRPFLSKKKRVFVIISDALRYENGAELSRRLLSENRFESTIEPMVSSLPSYTQLGMAALLPKKQLAFHENSDDIIVDGIPCKGIQGRTKILEQNIGPNATAIKAEDLMEMNTSKEGREFVKKYDVIYIYHNRIDKVGDDKTSESKMCAAVEEELEFLMSVIKKIAGMNGTNIMITSDHGFLYQDQPLKESDYCVSEHQGEVWKSNRRFIIGKDLSGDNTTKAFSAKQLGLKSDAGVLIPKSINRLKVKGAGSRFVHGGATMQEVVIPLIKINKKKRDTTSQVEVDIIKSTDQITTNILPVSFIQNSKASDTILPRTLRAALYSKDGEILSDLFKYNFDSTEGLERQRELKHRFQLTANAGDKYKNQRVHLRIEEPVAGSSKWKLYKEYLYTLNISFMNDFDDF